MQDEECLLNFGIRHILVDIRRPDGKMGPGLATQAL
jgi:hypothetical protein